MQLGSWLKKKGMEQKDLAVKLEVSRSTVSMLIAKQRKPGAALALRIKAVTRGKVQLQDLI